jgi:hypothetical protein
MNFEARAHSVRGQAWIDILAHGGLDAFFRPAPASVVPSAWYGRVPFANWIMTELQRRCVVELGTHNGVSYADFRDAASCAGAHTRCFAIDPGKATNMRDCMARVYRDLRALNDVRFPDVENLTDLA